jgi:hypothetical protein
MTSEPQTGSGVPENRGNAPAVIWPYARRARVPHHGPIALRCPVECLQTVLSMATFNTLARAYDAPFDPPQTVGDVVGLYQQHKLRDIHGVGRRRVSEIEVALVFVGLDPNGNRR